MKTGLSAEKGRCIETLARGVCVVEGHVLLCRGRKAGNVYLPGGHVDFGERAVRALAREIREEMGLTARVGRFLGCVEHAFVQHGEPHAEINLVFAMTVRGLAPDRPPVSREGWIEFLWQPLDRLTRSGLEPSVLRGRLPEWCRNGAPSHFASTRGAVWVSG
ncbi:MAG: NUDIX domain-containing protein [Kiritimatiellae bacterium]|nr:NUDIX domain-containing protein [Kiritimatiellia bacterium]